jgi:hypothetical protein
MADPDAMTAFRSFCRDFKPHLRICGGDHFDLRWLRRSASDDEKMERVVEDFEAGIEFLSWYKPSAWVWGNHDARLRDALDAPSKGGALRQLAGQWLDRIEVVTKGCKHYPYDKRGGVHQLGDLKILHGYAHGVGALRKQTLAYGRCLVGHVHRPEMVRVERYDGAWGYSSGCLCRTTFEYSRANLGTLAQEQGWAYGVMTKSGRTRLWLTEKTDGKWLFPSEMSGTTRSR